MKRLTTEAAKPVFSAKRALSAGVLALALTAGAPTSAGADDSAPAADSTTPAADSTTAPADFSAPAPVSTPAAAEPSAPAKVTPAATPDDTPTESGAEVVVKAAVEPAPNIVQVEIATGALIGVSLTALSVSYERMFGEYISVRVGYGMVGGRREKFGQGGGDRVWIRGHGGYAMVHAVFGDSHKLELGAGAGIVFNDRKTNHADGSTSEDSGTRVAPQTSIAYRYQPDGSGIFFRAGLVWTLGWGTPLGVGLGYSF